MIIGLSGYARVGKDEAGKGLAALGYQRVAFADKLREFLYALNPMLGFVVSNEWGQPIEIRLASVIDEYGWNGYKETKWSGEIRQLLQRLGTECGRELLSDTVWIDAALNGKEGDVVVTDVRFENEAQAIKNRGGIIVRINRPGVGPANSHASETSLDNWKFDVVVSNNSSIVKLHQDMRFILEMLPEPSPIDPNGWEVSADFLRKHIMSADEIKLRGSW